MRSTSLATLALCCTLIKANGVDESPPLGVGHAEEVPISVIPLFVAQPKIVLNEARNFEEEAGYDDETGEGSIELMPVNSIRVRFNPPIQKRLPAAVTTKDTICEEVCQLPQLPFGMGLAAKSCNSQLVFENSLLPRGVAPLNRRLDTTQRNICGAKCVLQRLRLVQLDGIPDPDRVTGYLHRAFGHTWTETLRKANLVCSRSIRVLQQRDDEEATDEDAKNNCIMASEFMKCIRETMTSECPEAHKVKECKKKNL